MCTRLNCLRLIPRPKPSILRLRHTSIHLRRYQVRGLNGCRDGLETRTSRPRPHSWSSVLWPRIYGFLRWFPWRAISRASALTLLGDRKGIRLAKNWMLVCWWWWFDWSFARLMAPVVTTTSIILCFSKHRLTQVHLENGCLNGERLHLTMSSVCMCIYVYWQVLSSVCKCICVLLGTVHSARLTPVRWWGLERS